MNLSDLSMKLLPKHVALSCSMDFQLLAPAAFLTLTHIPTESSYRTSRTKDLIDTNVNPKEAVDWLFHSSPCGDA